MNFEQPNTNESISPKDALMEDVNKLHFAIKNGEVVLVDTQHDDFLREATKLDKDFARKLPASGLNFESVTHDFKLLTDYLENAFSVNYWGSFFTPEVEEVGQGGGLGYGAKNENFMLIGTPNKPFDRENLSAVLVPRHYESFIDALRLAYPDVRFITVDEIKDLPNLFV